MRRRLVRSEHGIPRSTFYKEVVRLRNQACQIPERSGETSALDLAAPKEPVEIHVVNHPDAGETVQTISVMQESEMLHTDNSHMMEITIGSATIKVSNGLDPVLLQSAIVAAGRIPYAG